MLLKFCQAGLSVFYCATFFRTRVRAVKGVGENSILCVGFCGTTQIFCVKRDLIGLTLGFPRLFLGKFFCTDDLEIDLGELGVTIECMFCCCTASLGRARRPGLS